MGIDLSAKAPFPANESFGMQQAWRLFYDKANLKGEGNDSYTIQKTYPIECLQMYRRSLEAMGYTKWLEEYHKELAPKLTREELTVAVVAEVLFDCIRQSFKSRPYTMITATLLTGATMTASAFFFSALVVCISTVSNSILWMAIIVKKN
jgi:hypothetical protein